MGFSRMKTNPTNHLEGAVIESLRGVIDPETNADVIRMRLIQDLTVDNQGKVSYTFRPSSPLCPIAVYLVQQIKFAVSQVPGVSDQQIRVIDYIAAEELTELINKETKK
jgi:metal-sulfur cluster biosynthetic enzyme